MAFKNYRRRKFKQQVRLDLIKVVIVSGPHPTQQMGPGTCTIHNNTV